MHRLACAVAAGINEKKKTRKIYMFYQVPVVIKSNLAMQVFPIHDYMRRHSCLVEASDSIKLIQYAAGGTHPVKRMKYRDLENTPHTLKLERSP